MKIYTYTYDIQYHYDTLNQPSESIYVLLVIQTNKQTNKKINTTDNSTDTATATTTRINATAMYPHCCSG